MSTIMFSKWRNTSLCDYGALFDLGRMFTHNEKYVQLPPMLGTNRKFVALLVMARFREFWFKCSNHTSRNCVMAPAVGQFIPSM